MDNEQTKLLFVLNTLNSDGGVQRTRVHLLEYFAVLSDFQVSLAVVGEKTEMDLSLPEDVSVRFLNQESAKKSVFALRRVFTEEKPDIIVSAQTHVNIASILANLLTFKKTKIVCTEHRHASVFFEHGGESSKMKNRALAIIAALAYRFAYKVIFASRSAWEDGLRVFHLPESKTAVIKSPVVTEHLLEQMKEPVDHEWLSRKDIPIVIFVGRLIEQKGIVYLLEAFKKVKEKMPARLLILGQGSDRELLQEKCKQLNIENNVKFLGYQKNYHKYVFLSDVFVLPSLYEEQANILIEVMASGTPAISSDCPSGPSEIISDGKNGLLVKPADPDKLAEAIVRVLQDQVLSKQLSVSALHSIYGYHIDRVGPEFEKLFRSLVVNQQ